MFKKNMIRFALEPKSAIYLLNTLQSSWDSLTNTIVVHFVGRSHPIIRL
jgi:hypothetical protein